jgi:hypothetical protein
VVRNLEVEITEITEATEMIVDHAQIVDLDHPDQKAKTADHVQKDRIVGHAQIVDLDRPDQKAKIADHVRKDKIAGLDHHVRKEVHHR